MTMYPVRGSLRARLPSPSKLGLLLVWLAPASVAIPQSDPHPGSMPSCETTVSMTVDVDGAPNAYGPPGRPTLDYLRNAHLGERLSAPIVGFLTKSDHRTPVLQGPHDPHPGYYISTTAFYDRSIDSQRDMRRYLDATRVNYVVLGNFATARHVRLGDLAAVHSARTHRTVFAIVGDDGNPSGAEGSLALVRALGYDIRDGKEKSVDHREITIRYFPHTNPTHEFLNTQARIDAAARELQLNDRF